MKPRSSGSRSVRKASASTICVGMRAADFNLPCTPRADNDEAMALQAALPDGAVLLTYALDAPADYRASLIEQDGPQQHFNVDDRLHNQQEARNRTCLIRLNDRHIRE